MAAKVSVHKALGMTAREHRAQVAGTSDVGPAVARRLVGKHRHGRLQLRTLGPTSTTTATKRCTVYRDIASSPALFSWLMEAAVCEREGLCIDVSETRLTRMTRAYDTTNIARDAVTLQWKATADQRSWLHKRRD